MKKIDYPALYTAADEASNRSQAQYLGLVRSYTYLLIAGAGLSVIGIKSSISAACAAALFIASIFVSILMILRNSENSWYRARAIAESVKTSTWRFMMRADPYEDSSSVEAVKKNFRNLLRSILSEHKDLAHDLGGEIAAQEQITEKMCSIRNSSLEERIEFYRTHRIDEQRKWYAVKSGINSRNSKKWFAILIGLQSVAVILVLLRISYPEWEYWPTEVFVVAAGSALTWIQLKRFRELAAAYGLTAHEIGVVRGELESISAQDSFAQFVKDSENAFSREHTQWVARKDAA
ncbi:DUF4231 domain-containing protein [Pseudoalteromonas lipolytica]|uniref:DUF4231 domain-containing protein n=1 Tax=Pseudoalteromonas lipolytica TaxID=570156 RepID=UPI003A96A3D4